jgi:hypothetical protein
MEPGMALRTFLSFFLSFFLFALDVPTLARARGVLRLSPLLWQTSKQANVHKAWAQQRAGEGTFYAWHGMAWHGTLFMGGRKTPKSFLRSLFAVSHVPGKQSV